MRLISASLLTWPGFNRCVMRAPKVHCANAERSMGHLYNKFTSLSVCVCVCVYAECICMLPAICHRHFRDPVMAHLMCSSCNSNLFSIRSSTTIIWHCPMRKSLLVVCCRLLTSRRSKRLSLYIIQLFINVTCSRVL